MLQVSTRVLIADEMGPDIMTCLFGEHWSSTILSKDFSERSSNRLKNGFSLYSLVRSNVMFGDKARAKAFMLSPCARLKGCAPMDFEKIEGGYQEVWRQIHIISCQHDVPLIA